MEVKEVQLLYGLDVDTTLWNSMPYSFVLRIKVKLAKRRAKVLQNVNYRWRDTVGVTRCLNAVKHNEKLLKELD